MHEDRGVSDVVGYILLIGMVTIGVALVFTLGGSALDEVRGDVLDQTSGLSIAELDTRLSALSGSRVNSTEFAVRGGDPGRVTVGTNESRGRVHLSVNEGTCTATLPLSTVEYEQGDGTVVGFQAGGVFTQGPNGSSAVRSAPSFSTGNGTIDITTYDLSGAIDDRSVTVRKDTAASNLRSRTLEDQLTSGADPCRRPNNVTLTVRSKFYEAWASHIERETGVEPTVHDGNRTVRVFLDQEWLPRSANDERNRVVDLSDSSTAEVITDGGPPGSVTHSATTDTLRVDKGVGNNYTAVALPLGNGTQASYLQRVDGEDVYRKPVDVVFVMDESGSMGWNGESGQRKIVSARNAAKRFVGQINASKDRVGFVGFTDDGTYGDGRYHYVNGENYFTSDRSDANDTIDTYRAISGTHANEGLAKANVIYDLKSKPGRNKVIILLSDGRNDAECIDMQNDWYHHPGCNGGRSIDEDTLVQAERADRNGATVYTVGFGKRSQINETLLKETAGRTGGRYAFATNASELNAVFGEILANITDVRAIVHRPTAAKMRVGGNVVYPQLSDADPGVNRIDNRSYDVNDPEYRGGFEFAASPSDGNLINVTAVSYECMPDQYQLTDTFVTNQTTNETFRRVRCLEVDDSTKDVIQPSNVSIYLDGADVSAIPDDNETWWQDDLLNETLAPYTTGGKLDLASNEAVVIFRYPGDGGGGNRLAILYQIGKSKSEASTEVFDVQVVDGEVEGG